MCMRNNERFDRAYLNSRAPHQKKHSYLTSSELIGVTVGVLSEKFSAAVVTLSLRALVDAFELLALALGFGGTGGGRACIWCETKISEHTFG